MVSVKESRVESRINFVDKETSKSILNANIYFPKLDDLYYSVDTRTKYVSPKKFSDLTKEQIDFYNENIKVTVNQAVDIKFLNKIAKRRRMVS